MVAVTSILVGCGQSSAPSENALDSNNDSNQPAVDTAWNDSSVVENGDTVAINYVWTTEEDWVFDTSIESVARENDLFNEQRPYEPLVFTVGEWTMIPGMEQWVVGMEPGETKTLVIPPEEAYGTWQEDRVQELPLADFEEAEIAPEVGETYNFGVVSGVVTEISDEFVTLDFNSPLADKTLTFEVTLEEINPN